MTPFLYVFGVKESDEILILVIWGQLLPQRSPKGHLRSFSAKFSGLAPFLQFLKSQNSNLIIYLDSTWSPLSKDGIDFTYQTIL